MQRGRGVGGVILVSSARVVGSEAIRFGSEHLSDSRSLTHATSFCSSDRALFHPA